MEFVPATEQDLPEIKQMANQSLKSQHSLQFFLNHLKDFFYVAKEKGKILGFIIVRGKRLVLIVVDKSARRMGLGSSLVEFALQHFPELELKVRASNKGAIEFYKRTGWELVGEAKVGYRNGEKGFVFRKRATKKI
ncbi:hypothetical protein DRJ48_02205 [Candidatus Woesearchaeota archaeon]|nr:GNAT family N-acetyltransferase [Candidatus Woesearchaeota archaeon]RLE42993.1 MAG: hypothetical protein DRJ48_02205 [Candidatus Woesearchaeota archaeon]